ncbi:MAG TPA: L,D-transpeptidase family protein [Candidatus Paceibacterota bacterium]
MHSVGRTTSLIIIGTAILAGAVLLWGDGELASPHILPSAVSEPDATTTTPIAASTTPQGTALYPYIEVVTSCGPYYEGVCVNMRSGPSVDSPVVLKLRKGMVLRVADIVQTPQGLWYRIEPDKDITYPERITSDWYVSGDVANLFYDDGDHRLELGEHATTTKRIVVNLTTEMLYAYDGDTLFMQDPISTGLDATPTPTGTFVVFKMTPSRYMQGPIPNVSDQYYDLPGVPWNLYFTTDGAVIHGAYWHDHFGEPWSHGCINLAPDEAKKLYRWAQIGMTVTVER